MHKDTSDAIALCVLAFCAGLSIYHVAACASAPPVATTAEGQQILDYAAMLSNCEAVGREAGHLSVYRACVDDAGRDR